MAEVERSLAAAEAYDAAENLIGAYGYGRDDSPSAEGGTLFANQILQPVIDVAPDGKSAKVRARRLDLGGTSGGAGYWTAGTLEGQIVSEQGRWKFETPRSSSVVRTLSGWLGSHPIRWQEPLRMWAAAATAKSKKDRIAPALFVSCSV